MKVIMWSQHNRLHEVTISGLVSNDLLVDLKWLLHADEGLGFHLRQGFYVK